MRLPVNGDEAYYWEWSRHLAAGYVDHPPAVAYAIALFAWLGHSPFAIRAAFVLCGLITALAAGATASFLTRDHRAGAVTALALTLTPLLLVAFGTATPDGPYLAFWSLSLYCAVRAFQERSTLWFASLGLALGGAILSRVFGVALILGVVAYALMPQQRWAWRRGMWVALLAAGLSITPLMLWNAQNGWPTFVFALLARHHDQLQITRPLMLYATNLFAYSPGLFVAAAVLAMRPRNALIAWTALPLTFGLTLLSLLEPVEVYWFFGPYVSLSVAIGIAFVGLTATVQRAWLVGAGAPAMALSASLLAAVLVPATMYSAARHVGLILRNGGPFEILTYSALARDVQHIASSRHAIVMTDGYGFSSVLDFYGNIPPVVIGYAAQGKVSLDWSDAHAPVASALFVDKAPLHAIPGHPEHGPGRADFAGQLALACKHVEPGPTLTYAMGPSSSATPTRSYFTTWCNGLRSGGLAILRWHRGRGEAAGLWGWAAKPKGVAKGPRWRWRRWFQRRKDTGEVFP